MDQCENLGFPIAELEADGSCTITKEANTGGEVGILFNLTSLIQKADTIPGLGWYCCISAAL
jgi:hypothetical protein